MSFTAKSYHGHQLQLASLCTWLKHAL